MSRVRVLVVEDSTTVRRHIVEMLSKREDFEVVGEAADGKKGIELCQALRPDVITLDMMMPVMSGLAATEYIMAYCPTPILIVSSSTNRGELFKTFEALAAGALDVMEKPGGGEPDEVWEEKLLASLKLIARIKVITHPRGRLRSVHGNAEPHVEEIRHAKSEELRAVVIGASTGGPGAVLEVLQNLPADFPLPILLVIHLSRMFGTAFAEWLDGESPLRVNFVKHGEMLPKPGRGRIILAPPDFHMVLRQGHLWMEQGEERHSCRPSVDTLFESVAEEMGPAAVGCLLTGMGKDGAQGLLALRNSGATTIAQDEATCVVYGMPREAALLGAASKVLPLDQIAPTLLTMVRG